MGLVDEGPAGSAGATGGKGWLVYWCTVYTENGESGVLVYRCTGVAVYWCTIKDTYNYYLLRSIYNNAKRP